VNRFLFAVVTIFTLTFPLVADAGPLCNAGGCAVGAVKKVGAVFGVRRRQSRRAARRGG